MAFFTLTLEENLMLIVIMIFIFINRRLIHESLYGFYSSLFKYICTPFINKQKHMRERFKSIKNKKKRDQGLIFTLYTFDHCNFCNTFKPIWEKTISPYQNNNQHKFRHFVDNKLSDKEKSEIMHYIQPSAAPTIIMTIEGTNVIIEFNPKYDQSDHGLKEFIDSKGRKNSKRIK